MAERTGEVVPEERPSRLIMRVPEGFQVKHQMVVRHDGGEVVFQASEEALTQVVDAERFASLTGEDLKELPGYEEHDFEPAPVFGGRPGYRRRFSWRSTDEGAPPTMQVQAYYVFGGWAYTATATVVADTWPRWEQTVETLLDGLRLRGPDELAEEPPPDAEVAPGP